MRGIIEFILGNFTFSFLILWLLIVLIVLTPRSSWLKRPVVIDRLFAYFLLFNIGLSFLYNFVVHVFYGNMAAHFIGWAQSPFQAEVGFASLGFAIVGIIAFWSRVAFRAAAVIGPAFFLWGAAGGHIYQMIKVHNFAPGNAGFIFWTDILIPIMGFVLLGLQRCYPVVAE